MDPNPMPPGLHQYSVIVTTANREMKFTAPTKERHDIWFNVGFHWLYSAVSYSFIGTQLPACPSIGHRTTTSG